MVCLGNICRSPLAEGILQAKVAAQNVDIEVDSAGTAPFHIDDSPDVRSIMIARKHGVNITELRGRQFSPDDFDQFDRIYAMDKSNYDNVIAQARSAEDKAKVALILNELQPGSNAEVPDPYYGGDHGFENVYQMLDEVTDKIIAKYGVYRA